MVEPALLEVANARARDFPLSVLLGQINLRNAALGRCRRCALRVRMRGVLMQHPQAVLRVEIFDRFAGALVARPSIRRPRNGEVHMPAEETHLEAANEGEVLPGRCSGYTQLGDDMKDILVDVPNHQDYAGGMVDADVEAVSPSPVARKFQGVAKVLDDVGFGRLINFALAEHRLALRPGVALMHGISGDDARAIFGRDVSVRGNVVYSHLDVRAIRGKFVSKAQ